MKNTIINKLMMLATIFGLTFALADHASAQLPPGLSPNGKVDGPDGLACIPKVGDAVDCGFHWKGQGRKPEDAETFLLYTIVQGSKRTGVEFLVEAKEAPALLKAFGLEKAGKVVTHKIASVSGQFTMKKGDKAVISPPNGGRDTITVFQNGKEVGSFTLDK